MKKEKITLTAISIFLLLLAFSCRKNNISPRVIEDDEPLPPIEQKDDTVLLVKKIETFSHYSNPSSKGRDIDMTFHYDSQKRVDHIGLRNHNEMYLDSTTSYFFYEGNSRKPYKIVLGNKYSTQWDDDLYDTLYLSYDSKGRVLRDSTLRWVHSLYGGKSEKLPVKRDFIYPNDSIQIMHMTGYWHVEQEMHALRSDTIYTSNDGNIKYVLHGAVVPGYKIWVNRQSALEYSTLLNPCSKLNISGTIYSNLYQEGNLGVFGTGLNVDHANAQGIPVPRYFDLFSKNLAHLCYYGWLPFDVRMSPHPDHPEYPIEISVGAQHYPPAGRYQYVFYY